MRSDILLHGAIIYFSIDDTFTSDRILCGAISINDKTHLHANNYARTDKPHNRKVIGYLKDGRLLKTFSHLSDEIGSISEENIILQFKRSSWEALKIGKNEQKILHQINFGGMSGGPVFVCRKFNFEFIGVIYNHSIDFDLFYVRPVNMLSEKEHIYSMNLKK